MTQLNLRDVAFKAMWTGLSAVLGFLAVYLAGAPYAWAPVAIVIVNSLLALVRQKAGTVPVDARAIRSDVTPSVYSRSG